MPPIKPALKLIHQAFRSIALSPIYYLSGLVKRDSQKIVFGCHLHLPAGNILSFYKHCLAASKDKKIYWIAQNNETFELLQSDNLPVIKKNSLAGIYTCLTAKYFCYSSYISDINFTLSRNSYPINLWHGTPLKKIEADIQNGIYSIRYKYDWIFRTIQPWIFIKPYKIFTSSEYEKNCFRSAFKIKDNSFYQTSPPRLLDIGERQGNKDFKNILFAPTFRDGSNTNYGNLVDLHKLNSYCKENKINITIKAHPSDASFENLKNATPSNIKIAERSINIYSLLPEVDLLVTDYSSLFFDCHYLSIPFILHWPDFEFYISNCREFYFDPQECLSSLISRNDEELIQKISEILNSPSEISLRIFDKYDTASDYPLGIFEASTELPEKSF